MKVFILLLVLATALIAVESADAQGLGDAVRVSTDPLPAGTRGMSMGGAMISAANDYNALTWNPAALAPLEFNELGFGLWDGQHNSNATFFNAPKSDETGSFNLGGFGLLYHTPTDRGHLNLGLSYDLVRSYASTYSFSAINPSSSFLNTVGFVSDPKLDYRDTSNVNYLGYTNLAWNMYLANLNPARDALVPVVPINFAGGMTQSGTVTESGALHALRLGGGVDVADGISIGVTLNFYDGEFNHERDYTEADSNHVVPPDTSHSPAYVLKSATIHDSRTQTQSGFGLKIGFLDYANDLLRFGFTIETPTYMRLHDWFLRTGSVTFVGQEPLNIDESYGLQPIVNNYAVVTPFKLGAGISSKIGGLTIEASGTYSDLSATRYTDWDVDLSDLNDSVKASLRSVISWNLGAEFVIPAIGTSLRVGYSMEPSPYKGDPSNYAKTTMSAGVGILFNSRFIMELGYSRTSYHTSHVLYSDNVVGTLAPVTAGISDDAVSRDQFMLSFNYRFGEPDGTHDR